MSECVNLYAVVGDPHGDPYAILVVAPTRSRARYMAWQTGFDTCALNEYQASVRLAKLDIGGRARVLDTDDQEPELWAIAKERTGVYQWHEEPDD